MRQFLIVIVAIMVVAGASNPILPAQNRKIPVAGTVIDATSGQPLPGVNISVLGTSSGGITDETGKFTLSLTRIPAILYFSHVGYVITSQQVEKGGVKDIRILLEPEVRQIDAVTIRAEKISKVFKGDTIQMIDYELDGDRIILYASPYRNPKDQRLYLADLNGDTLSHLKVSKGGMQIKFPEIMIPQTDYLIRDFTGRVQFLDHDGAHEVFHHADVLSLGFLTPPSDFITQVLPIKCEMQGKLVFQVSTMTENFTFYFGRGAIDGKLIKIVEDKKAHDRYVSDILKQWAPRSLDTDKKVSVPIIRMGDEIFLFDFFGNHMEVFDSDLELVKKVPINFQNTTITAGVIFRFSFVDIDARNFTQTILFDSKSERAYAFFRYQKDNKQYLKEINLETGAIDRSIEIPEFPNISNVRVYDNVVYFLFDAKEYPYYRQLYRMVI